MGNGEESAERFGIGGRERCRHRSRGNDFRVDFVRLVLLVSRVSTNASFNRERPRTSRSVQRKMNLCLPHRFELKVSEIEVICLGCMLINAESETHPAYCMPRTRYNAKRNVLFPSECSKDPTMDREKRVRERKEMRLSLFLARDGDNDE